MPTKDKETQEFTQGEIEIIPWHTEQGECSAITISGVHIGIIYADKDADRFLLCWNSHDELVEALKATLDELWDIYSKSDAMPQTEPLALAALATATAQTQEDKK